MTDAQIKRCTDVKVLRAELLKTRRLLDDACKVLDDILRSAKRQGYRSKGRDR